MRLPLLAALGVVATLGIMTFDAPDANALTRRATVVTGARGAAVVRRPVRARGAVIVRRPLGTRSAVIARGPVGARGAVIMRRRIVR
jgi:hypothetical protein